MADDPGGNDNANAATPCQMPATLEFNDLSPIQMGPVSYDKSQSLVDIANNTFKELCRTLENEQSKLLELEERRKKLQEEMQRLKMEIEEERHTYRLHLEENDKTTTSECKLGEVDSGACAVASAAGQQQLPLLETCYEHSEKMLDEEQQEHASLMSGIVSQQSEALMTPITGCSETDCSMPQFNTQEPQSQAVVEEGQNESKM